MIQMKNFNMQLSLQVLKGPHFYAFGDHGGLIVAVRQKEITDELL